MTPPIKVIKKTVVVTTEIQESINRLNISTFRQMARLYPNLLEEEWRKYEALKKESAKQTD